jgi:hypothetical protein
MKSLTSSLVCFSILVSLTASNGFAAEKKKEKDAPASTPVSYSSGGSASTARLGVGASTYSITGVGGASASALIDLDGVNLIQPMFSIQRSSPFTFDIGAMYKRKLSHGGNSGFHIGGTLGLGTGAKTSSVTDIVTGLTTNATGTAFNVVFGGVAGIHYNLPGTTDLVLHVDAGPLFAIRDGGFDFSLTPFSSFFGATLIYMF